MTAPGRARMGGVPAILIACTALASVNFVQAVSTLYLQSRGQPFGAVFSLESVMLAAMLLAEVPSGHLADRFGSRPFLVLAFGAQFASQLVFAAAHSYATFAVASVLFGISLASLSGARETYVMELRAESDQREGLAHSFTRLNQAMLLGGLLSAGLGGQLALLDLSVPAQLTAASGGLGFVLSWFLPRAATAENAGAVARGSLRTAMRAIRRSPTLLFFSALPQFALLGAIHPILQPRLLEAGVTMGALGWIVAGGTLASVIVSQLTGRVDRALGLVNGYAAALAVASLGYVVASFAGTAGLVVGSYLIAVSLSFCLPMSSALKAAAVPLQARATTLSVTSFCGSLVAVAANLGIGALSDVSIDATLRTIAVVLGVLTLVWLAAARSHRSSRGPITRGVAHPSTR